MTAISDTDLLIKWLRNADKHPLKKILQPDEFSGIVQFITEIATPLDCNDVSCLHEAIRQFPNINRITVRAVVDRQLAKMAREQFRLNKKNAYMYLSEFYTSLDEHDHDEEDADADVVSDAISDADCATKMCAIACRNGLFPSVLCRLILSAKYNCNINSKLNSFLWRPIIIRDEIIKLTTMRCLWTDRVIGFYARAFQRATAREYERQLREILNRNHIPYVDKYYLRGKYGIRMVPTFELLQPFKYKGVSVCWIESQIQFGVIKTHMSHLKSYYEVFKSDLGTGLVIYWFGLQEELAQGTIALDGVLAADKFPNIKDLVMHQNHVSRTTLVYDSKYMEDDESLEGVD